MILRKMRQNPLIEYPQHMVRDLIFTPQTILPCACIIHIPNVVLKTAMGEGFQKCTSGSKLAGPTFFHSYQLEKKILFLKEQRIGRRRDSYNSTSPMLTHTFSPWLSAGLELDP
jgi:hypothetical protein